MADKTKEIQKKEAGQPDRAERTRAGRVYNPDVDIIERKDHITVIADMAGVDEKTVEITLEKNVLSIYGRVEAEIPEKMRLAYAEYGVGDYQRVFTISGEINKDRIEATVKNGVLKLIMPKAEVQKTRKIEVKSGD
jgi:HSP20 family protein